MKNTKYLFDEDKQTPEGMISVSQLQTFLSCRKKWEYGYIEEIAPKVERAYLTIGKLCHKGMQEAMRTLWELEQTGCGANCLPDILYTNALMTMRESYEQYLESVPHLEEELPDLAQMYEDAKAVFVQALEEFDPVQYEVVSVVKDGVKIPALELHFVVPCAGSKGMHGFIDAILRDRKTGFVWCTDYKFRKSLSPDEEEAFNIQNSVYSWACHKMGIDITGTMTWQHVNTPAAQPQVLKDGKLSKAKIKTTWAVFKGACIRAEQNPDDYEEEMKPKLAEIEWYRATYEYRNLDTIKKIWDDCVVPVSREIAKAHKPGSNNFKSLYPWNCKMCQYQSICQAEFRGYDVDAIKLREYTKRSHAR